jgi:hypothetical protein
LVPAVQQAIENSLGVSLDGVQIHADSHAHRAAETFSARAFTYGKHIFLGKDETVGDLRLIAHEAAHVVQQQGVPSIHRWAPHQNDPHEREADRAASAVARGDTFTVSERVATPRVQRFGLSDALDYIADKANNIPGFRMFTIVLGVNPVNMSSVDRSAANILRAVIEFIPGGALITEALDKYGVFDKVGSWVEREIHKLGMIGSAFKQALDDFLDSLHWSDIFHPFKVWERAKRIFTEPIDRLIDFARGLVDGIITFIKDAILMPLARLAEGTRGWDLLIAVLGKNPITKEPVPQDADTLIGGFMKLVGEEELWGNLKKAKAVSRAWAWFKGALGGLLGFVSQIPSLFIQALKSLELSDIILLPRALVKVATVFGDFVGKFITWAGNSVWTLLQIIFEVVAPGAVPYLKKVGASFRSILKDPIGFVRNLVKAGKVGFQQFADNIGAHLKASFIEWLTGSLPGVYIPASLDIREIIKFVLSVLGLTWQNIRGKLVKAVGETAVKAMETGFDIVVTLVKEGPAAAWEKIKEELSNLKDMVMQGIMDFIVETVVKKAVAKVLSLLVPGGAFIQAIISIYDTIMVFIDKLAKIIQVAKAFLDSMMEIASGAIAGAAKKVESTLAGLLTLAISFLAGFLGLGKIADKVMAIIEKIRSSIDKALDKVIDWIVTSAKKLFSKVFGKKDKDELKPGGDPADVRHQAATMAADRIKDDHTREEALAILRAIEVDLKPKGLQSLQAGPPNDKGTITVSAEASAARPLLDLLDPGFVPRGRSVVMATRLHLWRPVKQDFQYLEAEKSTTRTSRLGVPGGTGGVVAPGEFKKQLFIDVATWNTSNIDSPSTSHAEYQFWSWIESKKEDPAFLASISAIEVNMKNWSPCGDCSRLLASVMRTVGEAREKERSDPAVKPLIPDSVDGRLVWTVLYPGNPKTGVPPTTYDNLGDLQRARWQLSAPASALPTTDPHNKEFVKVKLISE